MGFSEWIDKHVGHMTLEEKIAFGRTLGVPHPKDPHPELARKRTRKEIKENLKSKEMPD